MFIQIIDIYFYNEFEYIFDFILNILNINYILDENIIYKIIFFINLFLILITYMFIKEIILFYIFIILYLLYIINTNIYLFIFLYIDIIIVMVIYYYIIIYILFLNIREKKDLNLRLLA